MQLNVTLRPSQARSVMNEDTAKGAKNWNLYTATNSRKHYAQMGKKTKIKTNSKSLSKVLGHDEPPEQL